MQSTLLTPHEIYMHRCLELAEKAAGHVAPNPMVGAVLVHGNRIIGEGFHRVFGGPHAEVDCINSVAPGSRHLISESVMYVSLEPCAHHGKTPPCADLIIRHNIRHVVIGCRDPFAEVDGKGIEKLHDAGIRTELGVLEKECIKLNKRFFTFHLHHRPYIILKWAQTGNGKVGNAHNARLHITGALTNRLVHKWRSEEASILVGTNTAFLDDPRLSNRLWSGSSPVRLVIDPELRLPASLHVFDGAADTVVFNTIKHGQQDNILFYQVARDASMVRQIVHALYHLKLLSVIVEGGAKTLQGFIDDGAWDEARVITNDLVNGDGVSAPALSDQVFDRAELIGNDRVSYYIRS